jgi:hypothetical protein
VRVKELGADDAGYRDARAATTIELTTTRSRVPYPGSCILSGSMLLPGPILGVALFSGMIRNITVEQPRDERLFSRSLASPFFFPAAPAALRCRLSSTDAHAPPLTRGSGTERSA